MQRDAAFLPLFYLTASGAHHPAAEFDDETAVLGDFDEAGGRNVAVFDVAPAQQRLHTDHLIGFQTEFRLVMQM